MGKLILFHELNRRKLQVFTFCSFCFLHSVAQAGVQWCNLSSLQPLRLLGSGSFPASASWVAGITGTHHHAQLIFYIFSRDGVSPCWPRGSRFFDLVIHPPRPPKVLGLQAWATALGSSFFSGVLLSFSTHVVAQKTCPKSLSPEETTGFSIRVLAAQHEACLQANRHGNGTSLKSQCLPLLSVGFFSKPAFCFSPFSVFS